MQSKKYTLASNRDIAAATPKRNRYSSKIENRSIVVVAGSSKFYGAPVLASNAAYSVLAALRTGIGYATEFVPKSILNTVRSLSPDVIVRAISGNSLAAKDVPSITRKLDRSECLVIGPGIGRDAKTIRAVRMLLDYSVKKGKKAVVDADAIHALVGYGKKLNRNFVITPNGKEFRLFYKKRLDAMDLQSRIVAVVEVSRRLGAVVVLKGHESIITDGKRTKVVKAKSSALAVMGTGDVLSGILGGYAVLNKDMFIASVAGTYLHAMIGDKLYAKSGSHILASDVVDYMPKVLKRFDRVS